MIDQRLSPVFLDWLAKKSQGQKQTIESKASEISSEDAANDGIRNRDYWRRTQLVQWCEANMAFSRPSKPDKVK